MATQLLLSHNPLDGMTYMWDSSCDQGPKCRCCRKFVYCPTVRRVVITLSFVVSYTANLLFGYIPYQSNTNLVTQIILKCISPAGDYPVSEQSQMPRSAEGIRPEIQRAKSKVRSACICSWGLWLLATECFLTWTKPWFIYARKHTHKETNASLWRTLTI